MKLDLSGVWLLCTDPAPCRFSAPPCKFPLSMNLPGTTAQQKIGTYNAARAEGFLSEKYPFAGQIWLRKTVTLPPKRIGRPCFLVLERTRMTEVWVNGEKVGGEKSLCTPHRYDLSQYTAAQMVVDICVKNIDYPTAGGHMTSADTQTNWIGITGELYLEMHEPVYISDLQVYPDAANRRITAKGVLHGTNAATAKFSVLQCPYPGTGGMTYIQPTEITLTAGENGCFSTVSTLPENIPLWSEYTPFLQTLWLELPNGENTYANFGLRDFKACGDHFEINGVRTMLRGKHDGLVFPLTGAAPTDFDTWLDVFLLMKEWGINHYRFHTCCPPEAAFEAADEVGIYLEPELPFWGTVDAPGGEKYNAVEQAYLLREGLRICAAFGNHPSFCMFSPGNELWGSKERLGEIITTLRTADPRPLYTQGSNNFQHMPVQIPEEDFWTGVRLGKGKLIRGSYATCDAPLGRIQTHAPSTAWNYEEYLAPAKPAGQRNTQTGETEISIQYGTGVKQVKAEAAQEDFRPTVPIVTHEIGQYGIYPDFDEITRYTGVLEARNFEIFRKRLQTAGMGDYAKAFFEATGKFSRDCYKAEIEAAMRSPHIAGFQLLDLQDYPGQGTALVGMLNALLENKGFIRPEEWRGFCGDVVPLVMFDSFVWTAGEKVSLRYALRTNIPNLPAQPFRITLEINGNTNLLVEGSIPSTAPGYYEPGSTEFTPTETGRAELIFELPGNHTCNRWTVFIFSPAKPAKTPILHTVNTMEDAERLLQAGEKVLLLTGHIPDGIPGFYCADFWNYPMFRSISESMGKELPAGTMGLWIDREHPIARAMFSAGYTEPPWYSILQHTDLQILDETPADYRPIVQMIDNVERNHRLGLIYEAHGGKLLVCTVRFDEALDDPAMCALRDAIFAYMED